MKQEISKVYPNKTWAVRVNNMGPDQVLAVYHKFLKEDRLQGSKVSRSTKDYYQLTIEDYILEMQNNPPL